MKHGSLIRTYSFVLFLLVFSFLPKVIDAYSRETLVLMEPLPFIGTTSPGLAPYLQAVFKLGIGIMITAGVLMIVIQGFRYMISDVVSSKESAKKWLMDIFTGLAIGLSAFVFLKTINPALVRFDLIQTINEVSGLIRDTRPPPGSTTGNAFNGRFEYQGSIQTQLPHAANELKQMLSCMETLLPRNQYMGQISSISDCVIVGDCSPPRAIKTFEQCASEGNINGGTCSHRSGSFHYGGRNCVGQSYAVDIAGFQNQPNGRVPEATFNTLRDTASLCKVGAEAVNEGNHVHISIGRAMGCGGADTHD